MKEIWKQIPEWEIYEASNLGRVRSWHTHRKSLPPPNVLKQVMVGQYWTVHLSIGKRRSFKVHTLIALAFRGPKPFAKAEVRHWNGKCLDNHEENILWGTNLDNVNDKIRHGTVTRGSGIAVAKLTESDVLQIRNSPTVSGTILAKQFGVSKVIISLIRRRKIWNWVPKVTSEDKYVRIHTSARGSDAWCSKLTESQVQEIRLSKLPAIALAKKFKVTYVTIRQIKRRQSWEWLPQLVGENSGLLPQVRGSKDGNSKLTESQVRRIRSSGGTGVELAEQFDVSTATISLIRNWRIWSWLK